MKHLSFLAAAVLAGNAFATPEVYLSIGRFGDPDKASNFSFAVNGGNTYFRWTAQAPVTDFAAVQPNAVEIKEVDPANKNVVLSTRSFPVTAANFRDKTLYVCTSWYWIGTCAKREYVNYKVLYGTEKYVTSKAKQAYIATFKYTPNGAAQTSVSTSMQTVEGLTKYCGDGDDAVGMRVYRPTNANAPAVVLSHGGFWRDFSPIEMETYAKKLQAAGYFVANIDYRLTPHTDRFTPVWDSLHPFVSWTDFKAQNTLAVQQQAEAEAMAATGVHISKALGDVKCAVRHLRSNASAYGVDASRIAVMGYSAGAHMSMMTGFVPLGSLPASDGVGGYSGVSDRVKAVVSLAGPSDLIAGYAANTSAELRCDFRAAMGFNRGECFQNAKGPALQDDPNPSVVDEAAIVEAYQPLKYAAHPANAGMPLLMVQSAGDELLNEALQMDAMVATVNTASGAARNAYGKLYTNGTHGSYNGANLCVNSSVNLAIKFLDAYVKGNGSASEVQTFTNALTAEPATCQ